MGADAELSFCCTLCDHSTDFNEKTCNPLYLSRLCLAIDYRSQVHGIQAESAKRLS